MERQQRIVRIDALLRRRNGVSMAEMMADLEVSRATICRDLEMMRDQMNAPIVWDRHSHAYRLDESTRSVGPTYMVPGLWLSPAQAYAYLTLHNMVEKMAPNLLGPFIDPLRGTLKQLLCESDFQMYGLDKKVEIEMPAVPALRDLDFDLLIHALLHATSVRIESGAAGEALEGIPQKLKITPRQWLLTVECSRTRRRLSVDIASIRAVVAPEQARNEAGTRPGSLSARSVGRN